MKKRYSHFIRPLFLLLDVFIINGVVYYISDNDYLNTNFLIYNTLFWIISSFFTGFYKVYRFTRIYRIFTLLAIQFTIFILGYFSYFSLFKEGIIINNQALVLSLIFILITFFKFLTYFALKKYRARGFNYRKVIVIGNDDSSNKIQNIIQNQKDLGYLYIGFFSDQKTTNNQYLGMINESQSYILENKIDEIYCAMSCLSKEQIKDFTKFATINSKTVKLIPDANEFYSKKLATEFYDDTLLVLTVKKIPFDLQENKFVKRVFDILFSLFVIIFILSWLAPIIWILIKLESKGSAFFKQKREGLNGKQFVCYKFRSMKLNKLSDKIHVSKNDSRVTKMGAFLRKTSLDELPQFFNVLKGEMSVVGPRPHLKSLSAEYQKDVNNYIERHTVKPGITGLAQISGYRGEILKSSDIKNRVRLDIFYIENWSIFLDIKIIMQTVFNMFKGEEKAY